MSTVSGKTETRQATHPARMGTRLRALLGALILLALGGAGWLFLRWEPTLLPIRLIQVEGEVHHHSSQQLQERLTERLRGGILTADLVDLKLTAEELPWVGQATLRRVRPICPCSKATTSVRLRSQPVIKSGRQHSSVSIRRSNGCRSTRAATGVSSWHRGPSCGWEPRWLRNGWRAIWRVLPSWRRRVGHSRSICVIAMAFP